MKLLILLLSFAVFRVFGEFSNPYGAIQEPLPFDDMGFYSNAVPMEKLLKETQAKIVIELGSWLGKSTRHIATVLPSDGKIYAVDHWRGSVEHQNDKRYNPYLPNLYDQFLSNIIHSKLTHKIVPVRMTTLEAVKKFQEEGIVPDIVYVDAAHDEQSVYEDLCAYYSLVEKHGILCGDDWTWGRDKGFPVRRAVQQFAKEKNLEIKVYKKWFREKAFWSLHKR